MSPLTDKTLERRLRSLLEDWLHRSRVWEDDLTKWCTGLAINGD